MIPICFLLYQLVVLVLRLQNTYLSLNLLMSLSLYLSLSLANLLKILQLYLSFLSVKGKNFF